MASALAAQGIKLAVSVWPDVQTDSINFANMSARGLLIRGPDGHSAPSVQGKDCKDGLLLLRPVFLRDWTASGVTG